MKRVLYRCIAVILFVATVASGDGKELANKRNTILSPDKNYSITVIPYGVEDFHDSHPNHLFLMRSGQQKRIPIITDDDSNGFDHCVEVVWSPDSKAFVINLIDPNRSVDSYIYDVHTPAARIDLRERLTQFKEKHLQPFFAGTSAKGPIIVTEKWVGPNWVEIYLEDTKDPASTSRENCFVSLRYRWNLKDKLIFESKESNDRGVLPRLHQLLPRD